MASKKSQSPTLNEVDPSGGLAPAEEAASKRLREALLSPARYVMSIDQALDGTGIAFVFPLFDTRRVEDFIRNEFSSHDERYRERADELVHVFRSTLARGGGALEIEPDGGRKKSYSFGLVVGPSHLGEGRHDFPAVVLHAHLRVGASNMPEWEQSRLIARNLVSLAEAFLRSFESEKGAEITVTLEGLALHGMKMSIGILPCLGALYTRIWEEFMSSERLRGKMREMPISSWKKAFSGDGRIDKKEIKQLLYGLGFSRIASDDEADATAMALTVATLGYGGKDTTGRIRPTLEEGAASRAKKLEKKRLREKRQAEASVTLKKDTNTKELPEGKGKRPGHGRKVGREKGLGREL